MGGGYTGSSNLTNCYITGTAPLGTSYGYTCNNVYATRQTVGTSGACSLTDSAVSGLTFTESTPANGKAVMDKAITNSTITSLYTITTGAANNSGFSTIVKKTEPGGTNAASTYNVYYAKGLGASGGPSNSTFTYQASYHLMWERTSVVQPFRRRARAMTLS